MHLGIQADLYTEVRDRGASLRAEKRKSRQKVVEIQTMRIFDGISWTTKKKNISNLRSAKKQYFDRQFYLVNYSKKKGKGWWKTVIIF